MTHDRIAGEELTIITLMRKEEEGGVGGIWEDQLQEDSGARTHW